MESDDLESRIVKDDDASKFIKFEIPIFKSITRYYRRHYGMSVSEAEHYAINKYSDYLRKWYDERQNKLAKTV